MTNPLSVLRGRRPGLWGDFPSAFGALDQWFDNFPESFRSSSQLGNVLDVSCNVTESDNEYVFEFDMPGIRKEDVKIELIDNRLTVSAERKEDRKVTEGRTRLSEISYGSMMRSFTLPTAVDDKKVDARYENGVLCITIPKNPASKAKQIAIH